MGLRSIPVEREVSPQSQVAVVVVVDVVVVAVVPRLRVEHWLPEYVTRAVCWSVPFYQKAGGNLDVQLTLRTPTAAVNVSRLFVVVAFPPVCHDGGRYQQWETFQIIYRELYQGLGLCLLAVFILTLVLIAHPLTAGLVFLMVTFTIVDVLGIM